MKKLRKKGMKSTLMEIMEILYLKCVKVSKQQKYLWPGEFQIHVTDSKFILNVNDSQQSRNCGQFPSKSNLEFLIFL